MSGARAIFHIDMNCFFASCEIAEHPELKGKKICIAHDSLDKKGIVLTASYEAKNLGVKTTMPLYEALKICPDLQIVSPHYDLYEAYSKSFFEYLRLISPLVEPASIDEGYIDVTELCLKTNYLSLAKEIQNTILERFNLPCSIGIASNKYLAKMASDMKKPLGITVLRKKDIPTLMWRLPIEDLFGCGKKTCELLRKVKINTIGDLANYPNKQVLYDLIGQNAADSFIAHCYGEGSNVVDPTSWSEVSSISNSHTLDHNEYLMKNILLNMKILANQVSTRLVESGMVASTFSVGVKFENFKLCSKSITLDHPTDSSSEIIHHLSGLLETIFTGEMGVRLISVGATKLSPAKPVEKILSIFDSLDEEEKDHELNKAINNINNIFGEGTLKKGVK